MERAVGVVVLLGVVDWAVHLDDEFVFWAAEIEDEGANWVLATESRTGELLTADGLPKGLLGECH
jgi:hypothetical protein